MSNLQMNLDDLANAEPVVATEEMPDDLQEMLTQQSGFFVRSEDAPRIDLNAEPVPGLPGIWRIPAGDLLTTIPGQEQHALEPAPGADSGEIDGDTNDAYRPAWADLEFLPRLVPFRIPTDRGLRPDHVYLEPRPPLEAGETDG